VTAAVLDTPTGVLVGTFSPGSEEWLAARTDGLGGSEVAAVLGLSPFESRFSLWHRKAGRVGPQVENEEMEWGKRLEAAVVGKFADSHPEYRVLPAGTYRHVDRPWQIGNPDRLLDPVDPRAEVEVLEAKISLYGDGWGPSGTDEIPVHVRVQLLWYLDTLGLRKGHVCVLVGGHDYREYTIYADPGQPDEIRLIRDEAEGFLASIEAGNRPDIDAHSATYDVIREMHPDIDPVDVELEQPLAKAYCLTRAALALAKADAQEAASLVADALGSGRRARFLGQTIATRQARGDGTPYLVAARGLPDFTDEEPN
jgi:putative phage-type endonuclease